jgi:beta-hydroxylase
LTQTAFEEKRLSLVALRQRTTFVFLDPTHFEFVAALEAEWEAIRAEYLSLPSTSFDPWVQRKMHGGGWSVFGLFAVGQPIQQACAICPNTARALTVVPGLSMAGFSRLAPRTRVNPHFGWAASVYRLHLALVVPPGCRLRVASETRTWHEGRCLIFDDTVEHEAWNDSELPRGVLLVDFLRPGLTGSVEDHIPEEVQQYAAYLFARGSGRTRR